AMRPPGASARDALQAASLGSREYLQNHGGATDGFLAGIFQDVLGRAIDAGAASFYSNQLAHGTSRVLVARQILSLSEAKQALVQAGYQQFLHHAPDAGGLAYWTNYLLHGGREDG